MGCSGLSHSSQPEKEPLVANQNDFWSWIMTDQAKTALAGAAGGVVRWVTLRERWQDGARTTLIRPRIP